MQVIAFIRKIFTLAAAVFILKTSIAQATISGVVRDNKQPINGTAIAIKDSYDGATTDSSGKFRFRTTEKGE